jgi:hypothetical protein
MLHDKSDFAVGIEVANQQILNQEIIVF